MIGPIGISSFAFASPLRDDAIGRFGRIAELGYRLVELCPDDVTALRPELLRSAAEAHGLALSVGGVFSADRDLSSPDPELRGRGAEYLASCIDLAADLGASFVSGPMYSAAGRTQLLRADERNARERTAALGLRRAADHAADLGIRLSIEPLNRFETDLVTTVEQGMLLVEAIDRANVGLTIDTFHAHIEERGLADAVRRAGERLFSVQASESDRGTPGTGQVHWAELFSALYEIDYSGPLVVESFDARDAAVATALSLWRPVAGSMDGLARDAIAYLTAAADAAG